MAAAVRRTTVLLTFLWACFPAALSAAGAEPWRAVEQPELKDALEGAAALRTESLGEPARGVK